MGVVSVSVIALVVFVAALILLKVRQADEEGRRERFCESASRHSLQFHAYDGEGKLLHHCQCHYKIRYGKQPHWCRVCADTELEHRAHQAFIRERTRAFGTNN